MQTEVYLSYDLTYGSDFDGLYKWLDKHSAKNCGECFCEFVYDFDNKDANTKEDAVSSFVSELNSDITNNVKLKKGDRLFIVSSVDKTQFSGFLYGNYGARPWEGYYNEQSKPSIKILS